VARSVSSRLTVVAALLALAVLAVPCAGSEPPRLRATAAGELELTSSRDSQAILSADGMRPGQSVSGTLTLANPASQTQRLSLATSRVADLPGRGGGVLSQRLRLRVEHGDTGGLVYAGTIAELTKLDLGDVSAGASRDYRFIVTLPEGGPAVDDPFADARTDVTWRWTGTVQTFDGDAPDTSAPEEPRPELGGTTADGGTAGGTAGGAEIPAPPPGESGLPDLPAAEPESSIPSARGPLRLWLSGPRRQRLASSLVVVARCQPSCVLRASGRVSLGGRRRALRSRALGRALGATASRLRFRLSAREARLLRAALRRRGRVVLTLRVRASAGADGVTAVHRIVLR
jgi:hypothetical protein